MVKTFVSLLSGRSDTSLHSIVTERTGIFIRNYVRILNLVLHKVILLIRLLQSALQLLVGFGLLV
jgi:hypothetical protein